MLAFIYGTAAIMKFSGNREQCEFMFCNTAKSPLHHKTHSMALSKLCGFSVRWLGL